MFQGLVKGSIRGHNHIRNCYTLEGTRPSVKQASYQDPRMIKCLREWNKLEIMDDCIITPWNRLRLTVKQLQLKSPDALLEDLFLALYNDLGHQSRDRAISPFKQTFFCLGLDAWI